MNIFIDTAVKGCNIVLFDNKGIILAKHQEPIERGHAEAILPLYQTLIQSINKTPQDIESIYVTVGPGSFTGLRVGLTVARFIGFSCQIPVNGVSTFQCFSAGYNAPHNRVVLIETKRSDYYVQTLDKTHQPIGTAQSLSSNDIILNDDGDKAIITGDAVIRFSKERACQSDDHMDLFQQDMFDLPAIIDAIHKKQIITLSPDAFYIRDADVSTPKKAMIK